MALALFKAKPARKRVHKPVEVFQLRNNKLIREELTREGHDSINEEAMSVDVEDWVDEDDAVQLERVKAAAAARMRLRIRVVNALFAHADEKELDAINKVIEAEKAGKIVGGNNDGDGEHRTPAEYQA